ncbi:MAG: VWA domain-containing protein [Phycisphaeraceae bacterium]
MWFENVDAYRPVVPPLLLAALVAAAVATAVWRGWHERSGPGVAAQRVMLASRVAALAALAWLIAGPSVVERGRVDGAAAPAMQVVALVDTSASMNEPAGDGATRWDVATRWIEAMNAETRAGRGPGASVLARFDERVSEIAWADAAGLEPVGEETRLLDAVEQMAARAGRGAVLVVISDGHDTHHREGDVRRVAGVAGVAGARGQRVVAVPIAVASDEARPRLAMQALPEADVVRRGESTHIAVMLAAPGLVGRDVDIELLDEANTVVVERRVTLSDEPGQVARLPVTPGDAPGAAVRVYHVRAAARDDAGRVAEVAGAEVVGVAVQVVDEPVRVLLLEGQPGWSSRFLARLLEDEPGVELTAVHRIASQRRLVMQPSGTAPASVDELIGDGLRRFDVVVLGRAVDQLVGPGFAERVAAADVALLASRGATGHAGLDALLPAVGDDGLAASAPAGALPGWLRDAWTVMYGVAGDAPPRGAASTTGEVRSLHVTGDAAAWWRGLMRGSDGSTQPQRAASRFWGGAVRWLATGEAAMRTRLRLARAHVQPGEDVGVYVELGDTIDRDAAGRWRIEATAPDGQVRAVALSATSGPVVRQLHTTYRPEQPGLHRLRLTGEGVEAVTGLSVGHRAAERLDMSPRPDVLVTLAEATGGRVLSPGDPQALHQYLAELADARRTVERLRYDPARPGVLALILGALAAEWFARRWRGLA